MLLKCNIKVLHNLCTDVTKVSKGTIQVCGGYKDLGSAILLSYMDKVVFELHDGKLCKTAVAFVVVDIRYSGSQLLVDSYLLS